MEKQKRSSANVSKTSPKRKHEDSDSNEWDVEGDGAKVKEDAVLEAERDAEEAALEADAASAPDVPGVDEDETVTEEEGESKDKDEYEPESNKEKENDSDYEGSESEDNAKPRRPAKTRSPEDLAQAKLLLGALSVDEMMSQLRRRGVGDGGIRRQFQLADIYAETVRRIHLGDPIFIARLTNALIKKTEGPRAYCANVRVMSALTGMDSDSTESTVIRKRKWGRKMNPAPVASAGAGSSGGAAATSGTPSTSGGGLVGAGIAAPAASITSVISGSAAPSSQTYSIPTVPQYWGSWGTTGHGHSSVSAAAGSPPSAIHPPNQR